MAKELPPGIQKHVFDTISGAFKSRDVLEAERPAHLPLYDDDRVMVENWTSLVDRQGRLLALLSVNPSTKAELMTRMPNLVNLSPAWVDAQVHAKPMTWELLMLGLAQTAAEQRSAIEQVVAEQVEDPDAIEEALAEAPVPTGTEGEDRSALMTGVVDALLAHTKALADIAYDLEVQTGRSIDPNELL